jgi:hypothetical protein
MRRSAHPGAGCGSGSRFRSRHPASASSPAYRTLSRFLGLWAWSSPAAGPRSRAARWAIDARRNADHPIRGESVGSFERFVDLGEAAGSRPPH